MFDDEVVDSEEERELQEEEKDKFEVKVQVSGPLPPKVKALVVFSLGQAQSLSKIIFHGHLSEVIKGEVTQHEKTVETLKVYFVAEHSLLVVHPTEKLKSAFVNQHVEQLFAALSNVTFDRVVVLDALYKTHYSTTDTGHLELVGDTVPIKYYKSSWANKDQVLANFLPRYKPAGVLNLIGGLQAGILIHAEINGLPAAEFVIVLDSHYVTSETLQGFSPIVNEVLELNNKVKLDQIHKFPAFKDVLKEANNRGNNIFN